MRAVLLILIILIVAIIIAVATGLLNINMIRGGQAPRVSATTNGVAATGAQAPAFDIETGSIKVGTKDANVKVPSLEVVRPSDNQAATTNNAM